MCLDAHAHGLRIEHDIFRTPHRVELTIEDRTTPRDYALSPDPDGVKNLFGLFYSFTSSNIPSVVVTFPFETAGHINPIGPFLKSPEYMNKIHLTGTGDENDSDVARV